ncbi:hypothetical protein FBU31_005114, partial [Coemansia sp. 'formosensis']
MDNRRDGEATSSDDETATKETPTSTSSDTVVMLKRRPSSSHEQSNQPRTATLATAETLDSQQQSKRRHISGPRVCGTSQRDDSETKAAGTIQRAWRRRVLSGPVDTWRRANVTVDRLKSQSFEAATQLMRGSAIVESSEALMQALLKTGPALSGGEAIDSQYKLPGRTFIVGHLFTAHPQLLVTDNSQLDAMVGSSAMAMTQTYAQFAAAFTSHQTGWYQKLQASVASFKAFYSALNSWKRSDAKELVLAMERHYLELDRLGQSVQRRTLGEGDETWQAGIQGQQDDLLAKIRTLGGSDAVEALMQKQRELRLTYSDPQPSPTGQLRANDSIPSPVVNGVRAMHVDSRHGAETVGPGDQSVREAGALPDSVRPPLHSATGEAAPASSDTSAALARAISDPTTQDVDRVLGNFDLSASAALQDAKLAHELVLDPYLRLEPAATNTLVGAVQQAVCKAFFAHIKQEIALGNSDHVIDILTQLRLDMRTIVLPGSQQRAALDRELDPEWMTTQLSNGALDIHAKFRLVLLTARSVCAPIRDSTIDSLLGRLAAVDFSTLVDIHTSADSGVAALSDAAKLSVERLLDITQEIMQLIRDVRLDALNHQLDTTVRPWLRLHAIDYEQTKMAQLLETQYQGNTQQI